MFLLSLRGVRRRGNHRQLTRYFLELGVLANSGRLRFKFQRGHGRLKRQGVPRRPPIATSLHQPRPFDPSTLRQAQGKRAQDGGWVAPRNDIFAVLIRNNNQFPRYSGMSGQNPPQHRK